MLLSFIQRFFLFVLTITLVGCHQSESAGSGGDDTDTSSESDTQTSSSIITGTDSESGLLGTDSFDTSKDSETHSDTRQDSESIDSDSNIDTSTDVDSDTYSDTGDVTVPCREVAPADCQSRNDCITISGSPVSTEQECYEDTQPVECLSSSDFEGCFSSLALAVDNNGQCWLFSCLYVPASMTYLPASSNLELERCGVRSSSLSSCQ